jgi:AcrR family transcriptional regulator
MARRSDHTREELHVMILDAAREIVAQKGFANLTIRRIGEAIGYSSGTLYNVFDDVDDIVLHLNATTLDSLSDELAAVPVGEDIEAMLISLAEGYIRFVETRPHLWGLLFQKPSTRKPRPDWYEERVERSFALLDSALDPVFESGSEEARREAALVLWSGLHGMCTLATEGIVLSWDEVRRLSKALVTNYVAGLQQTSRRDSGSSISSDRSKSIA